MSSTPGMRSERYLDFIRCLPCAVCDPSGVLHPWDYQDGVRRSEPDHLPSCGLRGIGMKSPDFFTVPLCRACHEIRGAHFRTPHPIYLPSDIGLRRLPHKFSRVNFWEITSRLLWAWIAGPPAGQAAAEVPL